MISCLVRFVAFVTFIVISLDLQAVDPPNILFFFTDDQRADTIAALGNPAIQTPNLNRLVKNGLAFQKAYMQGGMIGATCVPSRAMLLSGQSLFRIDPNLRREAIWPEAFAKAGYKTFISGKWHNGDESLTRSFQTARSMFTGGMTDPMKALLRNVENGRVGTAKRSSKHACEVFADEAVRFLREHKSGPFMAYIPFDGPHDPHIVPDDFSVRYSPESIPIPPNFMPQHPWNNGEMEVRDEKLLPWPREKAAVQSMLADYYRYITFLDLQIGRVMQALTDSGFADNTIVVFSSDSGVARGSHGLIGKQNLYEHSVRVPLIISGPGIPKDRKTDALCYLFDIFPTLGNLCQVSAPNEGDGFNLAPVLADPSQPARPELMFAYRDVQRAYTDGRWKLIRYPQVDETQLFDLGLDPFEMQNLVDHPEQHSIIDELLLRLEKQMLRFGDNQTLQVAAPRASAWSPRN
jgi:arylsulfatase A-like enzyme